MLFVSLCFNNQDYISHRSIKWKIYCANTGLTAALFGIVFASLSSATFVDSAIHYIFASIGAVLACAWIVTISFALGMGS